MNFIISVVAPQALDTLTRLHAQLQIPLSVTLMGYGTAVQSMLDLLGIDSNERRIMIAVASDEKTAKLLRCAKRELYIGVPGHGIVVSVPVRSVGGGNTVQYLNDGEVPAKATPKIHQTYELIVAIVNEGRTDLVMNVARRAGATGGTVLHGKGTVSEDAARFLHVSIADEKEIILMVTRRDQKSKIMHAVLQQAGAQSPAGTVLFSLPVSDVAGFGMFEGSEDCTAPLD